MNDDAIQPNARYHCWYRCDSGDCFRRIHATAYSRHAGADDHYCIGGGSLTEAFRELGPAFKEATGTEVIFNFGSSGQLAEQIRQGAPVDVYAAANVDFVDQLDAEGLLIPETKTIYAQGRITLWVPKDSPLQINTVNDLVQPEIKRIARQRALWRGSSRSASIRRYLG